MTTSSDRERIPPGAHVEWLGSHRTLHGTAHGPDPRRPGRALVTPTGRTVPVSVPYRRLRPHPTTRSILRGAAPPAAQPEEGGTP